MNDSSAQTVLERDLALVLAVVPGIRQAEPVTLDQGAIDKARKLIAAAQSPVIMGLPQLSIEAMRQAIALAEHMRGRLIVEPMGLPLRVMQTATLGHVMQADYVLHVGDGTSTHKVIDRLHTRGLRVERINNDLQTVTALRGEPAQLERYNAKRIGVVIDPDVDDRVVSQWHKLAADVQHEVRVAVLSLPAMNAGNLRGVIETIAWQTGISCASGGVSFADGVPRACGAFESSTCDLVIDASTPGRITVGNIVFTVQGLAVGVAARVMRFDGIVLWLCDDPMNAITDAAAQLFERLR